MTDVPPTTAYPLLKADRSIFAPLKNRDMILLRVTSITDIHEPSIRGDSHFRDGPIRARRHDERDALWHTAHGRPELGERAV